MHPTPTVSDLLRASPGFRLLWAGTVVSFLGDWLTMVATLTIVAQFSEASLWVSAVLIAKTLPIFLIAPWAGPLADRFDRRIILLATDVLRAALVLCMLGAYWAASLPGVMLFLTLRTFVGGCFIPARTAAIPDLVHEHELPVAMAVMGGTWSVMLAVGAALGGVLTELVGIEGALVADALTFVLSAVILWGLPALPPHSPESRGDTRFRAGLAYLRGRVYLPAVLLLKPALSLSGAMTVLLPLFAGGLYPGWQGPLYLGLLYAARGLGSLIGSLGVRRIIGDAVPALHSAIGWGFLLLAATTFAMAYSGSFVLTGVLLLLGMIGSGVIWPFAGTLGQLATQREVRGRLFALEFGLSMLGSAVAFLVLGALLDVGVTPRAILLGLAGLLLLPGAAWVAVIAWAPDVPGRAGLVGPHLTPGRRDPP